MSLFSEFIIINLHTANPEQSGDAKLEGPYRTASCTHLVTTSVSALHLCLLTLIFIFMKEKKPFKLSIRVKTIITSLVLAIFTVEIAVAYYAIVMARRNNDTFNNIANSISATIAETIDVDDFQVVKNKVTPLIQNFKDSNSIVFSNDEDENKVLERWEYLNELNTQELGKDADYQKAFENLRSYLSKITASNKDNHVDCTYIGYLDSFTNEKGEKVAISVYILDSAEEDACPPGWVDPIYDINKKVIDDPEIGFPAYKTNTEEYGYLLTSGKVVKDKDNRILGYAYVDISLNEVRAKQAESIVRLSGYMFITVAIVTISVVIVVHFVFAKPVRKLASVANSFDSGNPEKSHEAFANLKVNTHDELTELAVAMKNVEAAVRDRIAQLTEANEALRKSQQQTQKMTILANRDSLTGVQSKTAYDTFVAFLNERIEKEGIAAFGLAMIDLNYLKDTNDNYGHDAGDTALINLAHTICLIFKHSPVYRVGGDEFVVALRGEDFANHEALIKEFKERIDAVHQNQNLPIQERISAAIGYSEFDKKKDKCVDDVFKRADKEMYQDKKKMKETK